MKKIKSLLVVCTSLIIATSFLCCSSIKRLSHVNKLFKEDRIVDNFRTLDEYFPIKSLAPSPTPFVYTKGALFKLPTSFVLNQNEVDSDFFLEGSKTTGLLIIQNDEIILEEYYLGNTEDTQNIAWSVSKSFISVLFGIAIDEGYIKSVEEKVGAYVPELKESAYGDVRIKDVLQMSSGVKFNEDYGSFFSDINRWGRSFALGKSQDKFVGTLDREVESGTYHHYVSIDTHVLGMIISRATKRSITDYMQEKLWNPLGMEFEGCWITDNDGVEAAMCGLSLCLRDFAKLGSLYAHKGMWNGTRIISEKYIYESTTPDSPHIMPGDNNPNSSHSLGYGYQWWIPNGTDGEILAQGVYNQTIYMNPTTQTIIVKLSANDKYNDGNYIPSQWQAEMAFNREIVKQLGK